MTTDTDRAHRHELTRAVADISRPHWWDYLRSAGVLAAVFATAALIKTALPFTGTAVLDLMLPGHDGGGTLGAIHAVITAVMCALIAVPLLWPRLIRQFAAREEMAYRWGSENQSWPQRLGRQARFGAVHLLNLIVPIALAVALAGAGLYLLAVYLRTYRLTGDNYTAVVASTRAHVAYNRVALALVAGALALLTGEILWSLLMATP